LFNTLTQGKRAPPLRHVMWFGKERKERRTAFFRTMPVLPIMTISWCGKRENETFASFLSHADREKKGRGREESAADERLRATAGRETERKRNKASARLECVILSRKKREKGGRKRDLSSVAQ